MSASISLREGRRPSLSFSRRRHAFTSLVIVVATLLHGNGSTFAEKAYGRRAPNIVLIVADDLGAHDLACYGSTFHRTPRLDELTRRGVRFTQAYAACPVCSPTRSALMTGRAPARTGITDWLPGRPDRPDQKLKRPTLQQQLPREAETIAEALRSAGYATGHIGKWHLGGEGFGPCEQGFDLNIAGDHAGSPASYFAPYRDGRKGRPSRTLLGLENAPEGEYLTDRLGEEAAKFIANHADRPFFLYLSHFAVHTPMRAPVERAAKFDPTGRKPGSQQNPIYAAMLESLDTAVGRVLDTLAEHDLTDDTLIVFTSDNGGLSVAEGPNTPATSNAPLREGKGYLYEGGIRVPLIVAGFGVNRVNRTIEQPVWSCDLPLTLADVAGTSISEAVDGVTLRPLLSDAGQVDRDALYWHYPHYANQGGRPGGAIRVGDLKLIQYYESNRRELYDLRSDPRESKNLASQRPDDVARLAQKLEAWRETTGALMPTPNPDYLPNPQAPDDSIVLAARTAEIQGTQLRFEPAPHKNTLGFWTDAGDQASWQFTVARPGRFEVELLQGCGRGQGGSEVEIAFTDEAGRAIGSPLRHTVQDTGHFQNFVPQVVGTADLTLVGRYRLTVTPRLKKAAAVMDLRQIKLTTTR